MHAVGIVTLYVGSGNMSSPCFTCHVMGTVVSTV